MSTPTPITDHASLHTDAFDSPSKAREFARRLELDRSALMEICDRLVQLDLNGTDDSLVRFIVVAHQNSATQTIAAARANFPAPSTPIPEARTPQSTYQNHDQ